MDMDMDMDMGCRREAPQLDVPVRGGGEAEPRGGIECERARRERVRAPLRPLPLLPQVEDDHLALLPTAWGIPWLTRKWKRRHRADTGVSAAASPGIQVAKAPLSGPQGCPEQVGGPLERWVAAWPTASWHL